MIPDPTFWWRSLVWIGGEIAAIALLAGLGQLLVRSPAGRKTIWRAALVVALLAFATEATGLVPAAGRWLNRQFPQPPVPSRIVTVQVATSPVVFDINQPLPMPVATARIPAKKQSAIWWPAWVWLGGVGLIVGYRLMAGVLFLRLKRRMQPATDPELIERVHKLAMRLALTKPVRLFATSQVAGPFTFGLRQPAIGLPTGFTSDFTAAQQDAILAHELGHIVGRDFLWQRIGAALLALLWWHPAAWWMLRQLAAASEQAADEASLLLDNGPDALAESLVILGRKMSHSLQPILLGVEGAGFRSALAKRVQRLWEMRDREFRRPGRRHLVMSIAGSVLILGCLTVVATVLPRQSSAGAAWRHSLIGMAAAALAKPEPPVDPTPPRTNRITIPLWLEPAINTGAVKMNPGDSKRQVLRERLTKIILPRLSCDGTRIFDVMTTLSAETKKADPEHRGVNFILNSVVNEEMGKPAFDIQSRVPVLTNITVLDAMNVIVKATQSKIKYSIEDYAVVFSSASPDSLYTRVFKVDTNAFHQSLRNIQNSDFRMSSGHGAGGVLRRGVGDSTYSQVDGAGRRDIGAQVQTGQQNGSGISWLTQTNTTALGDVVRTFFRKHGVTIDAPKFFYFNDRSGLLMVRANLADLDTIEKALATMQASNDKTPVLIDLPLTGRLLRSNQVELTVAAQDQTGQFDYDQSTGIATADKGVMVQYGSIILKAKKVTLSQIKGQIFAEGEVQLLNTSNKFSGDRLTYDLKQDRILDSAPVVVKPPTNAAAPTEKLLNQAPPQLTIEARFCEVAAEDGKVPDFEKLLGIVLTNAAAPLNRQKETQAAFATATADLYGTGIGMLEDTNAAAATLTGILTAAQYKDVLRRLEKQKGVDILSVPKVTTLSGRQAQIKVVDIKYVVTGLAPSPATNSPGAKNKPGELVPVTEPFELGPVLDVVPWLLADGQTIQMTVIPMIREFLGYDDHAKGINNTVIGPGKTIVGPVPPTPLPLPRFRQRQVVCSAAVHDGQTLVLAGGSFFEEVKTKNGPERRAPKGKQAKSLLIFVTPTLREGVSEGVNP